MKTPLSIVHVIPHISEEASGPSYSVPRLCTSLAEGGHKVKLSCLAAVSSVPGVNIRTHPQWQCFSRFAVSPELLLDLRKDAGEVDIVHNHSLWAMPNVGAGWVALERKAKVVVSPRGTLSEWAMSHSRRIKQLVWPFQKRLLSRADLLHATSEAEYEDIRRHGFQAPVVLLPNGIDLPIVSSNPHTEGKFTLLFLGRLHPVKGIEFLLDAWQLLQDRFPQWQLRIVGKGDAHYVEGLCQRAQNLKLQRVEFAGPLYGEEKRRMFASSHLFILPSYSENFGMAVAESLAYGCPAIVTHGAPWQGLERERCGWWIEQSVDSLSRTLEEAMSLPKEELREMGKRGIAWMGRDFSWQAIARSMELSYRWILGEGERPEFIRVE